MFVITIGLFSERKKPPVAKKPNKKSKKKNQIKIQKNPSETQNRGLIALRNVREEEDRVKSAEEENDKSGRCVLWGRQL